jgi:predicted nucleic acid-binding protein
MGKYLIDNNVISNYFSGLYSQKATEFLEEVMDEIPNISIITQIEALSWVNSDKSKEAIIKEFINDSNVIGLDSFVVNRCVKIRRSRKIKTPDAIIAASAIENNLTLITSDADFANIPALKVLDPKRI